MGRPAFYTWVGGGGAEILKYPRTLFFTEIEILKSKLERQTQETDFYKREAEVQRQRNLSLQDKLEAVSRRKDFVLERNIAETKIRHGIRMTKYFMIKVNIQLIFQLQSAKSAARSE